MTVLAVTGLRAEARIAERIGLAMICAGGVPERTAAALNQRLLADLTGIVSFGIAGGLDPRLAAGTLVVGRRVLTADGEVICESDPGWADAVRMASGGADADIVGGSGVIASATEKATVFARTKAAAIDLESRVAGEFARRAGLPFLVLRAIADPAERSLPAAALLPLRPDGRPDLPAIALSLLASPGQILPLITLARESAAALSSLRRATSTAVSPLKTAARVSLERRMS